MLPKKHRLPLKTEFLKIKKQGRFSHGSGFSLLVLKINSDQPTRFGFVVSTKVHKRAVQRNQVRRWLIAAVRSLLAEVKPGHNVVFLAKKSLVESDFGQTSVAVKKALSQAGVLK